MSKLWLDVLEVLAYFLLMPFRWIWGLLDRLTWRIRHVWTFGHIPFQYDQPYRSWTCRRCFELGGYK